MRVSRSASGSRLPWAVAGVGHGAEFDHAQGSAVQTGARLAKEHRRTKFQTHKQRYDRHDRRKKE